MMQQVLIRALNAFFLSGRQDVRVSNSANLPSQLCTLGFEYKELKESVSIQFDERG